MRDVIWFGFQGSQTNSRVFTALHTTSSNASRHSARRRGSAGGVPEMGVRGEGRRGVVRVRVGHDTGRIIVTVGGIEQ